MKYRRATFGDIEAVYNIINDYAATGVMLARSRNALYEAVRDMIVAEEDGAVVGVGCLHFIWDRLAEVRSMAIRPDFARHGIGAEIVRRLIEDGEKFGVEKVFTLTYKPEFFETLGFVRVTKDELPHKVWKDCIDCPKFPNCDEIAMVRIV
ncbi:MAG: N-acetyltransferase [Selenomonadaceae bacterium]|nr:N-acetyltransferase [Selenomonadaceae bacterium]